MITAKQWTAFRLVFTDGLSYEDVGKKMQISKPAVAGLIKRIRNKYPDCVPNTNRPKTVRYELWMDGQVKDKW